MLAAMRRAARLYDKLPELLKLANVFRIWLGASSPASSASSFFKR
jgi:hypothetical protein